MKYELVVLSENNLDVHPSVMLIFDDKSYIFNVPEQTQRIALEYQIRLSRLQHIFVTSMHPRSFSGFQGLLISPLLEAIEKINFSGPPFLDTILETYSHLHTDVNVRPKIITNYSDKNITVTEYPLSRTVAFEVKLCDIPGKFNVNKAKEIGIPPGPLYRQLTDGRNIEINGKIIQPSDVIENSIPGDRVLFVDVRCEYDLDELENIEEVIKKVDIVIHFTPLEIINSERYKRIFEAVETNFCFPFSGKVSFKESASFYMKASNLSSLVEPLAVFGPKEIAPDGYIAGESGLSYQFAPIDKKGFKPSHYERVPIEKEFMGFTPKPTESFVITFLGTGGMTASRMRNVTGILIQTRVGFVVLDPGEGFVGQLRRKYGIEGSANIMRSMKLIFISHSHGDHIFGILELLQSRAELVDSDIPVCAPEQLLKHVAAFELSSSFGMLKYIPRDHFRDQRIGPIILKPIKVNHCPGSKGCLIDIPGGYKVAFSGDRGGNDNFPKSIHNCNVLIHEATFSDFHKEEAIARRHSTISMALKTSQMANSEYIVLTHFSQRYPFVPTSSYGNAVSAFDYLSISYENIEKIMSISSCITEDLEKLKDNGKAFGSSV